MFSSVSTPLFNNFFCFTYFFKIGKNSEQRNSGSSISVVRWRWSAIFFSPLGSGPADQNSGLPTFGHLVLRHLV
jgi:hypothetical protein